MPILTPPIWVTVLGDRRTLLFTVLDDKPLNLPVFTPPFSVESVTAELHNDGFEVGKDIRVLEAVNPHPEVGRQRAAIRAEQGAKEHMARVAMKTSNSPLMRTRSQALERKTAVDKELAEAKKVLSEAKSAVYSKGRYSDPSWFRGVEARIETLKLESQGLQQELGKLKAVEKAENVKASGGKNWKFRDAARKMLPIETYHALVEASEIDEDDEDDAPDSA